MKNRLAQTVALLLIGLGVLLIASNLLPGTRGIACWWPLFVLLPGLAVLLPVVLASDRENRMRIAGLVVPGSIITTIGLILLFGSLTGYWLIWAYAWALIPASAGAGLYVGSLLGGWHPKVVVVGRWLLWTGLLVFASFALLFEAFIFRGLGGLVVAVALLALGLLLLFPGTWRGRIRP